jgi:ribosome-associated protein
MKGPEPEPEGDEAEDLRSRTDLRREQKRVEEALMVMARRLVDLPERSLGKLELPEQVLDVVERARRVQDQGGPKNRALRLVRIALRDADVDAIDRQLDDLHEVRHVAAVDEEIRSLRDKLVSGGEDALNELVARYQGTDRQKLRNLVRNARRAAEPVRERTLSALEDAIREAIR